MVGRRQGGLPEQLVDGIGATVTNFFTGLGESFTTGLEIVTTTIVTFVESTLLTWANFFIGLKDDALIALQGIGLDVTGSSRPALPSLTKRPPSPRAGSHSGTT